MVHNRFDMLAFRVEFGNNKLSKHERKRMWKWTIFFFLYLDNFPCAFSFIVLHIIIMIVIVLRLRASKMIFRTEAAARPTKRRGDDLVGPSKTYATSERLINRQLHTHSHSLTHTHIREWMYMYIYCLVYILSSFKWVCMRWRKIYFARLRDQRQNYLKLLTDFPCPEHNSYSSSNNSNNEKSTKILMSRKSIVWLSELMQTQLLCMIM